VRVTPKQANSLAMVINELATNSLKYALLKNRQVVQVKVSITLDEDGMVLLEYRDDGPGFPDSVLRLERQNVGMHLIHNISRRDLRGDVALRNDQGAVVTLRFPNLIVE
jgi:two-component sensor histidine kinase